MIDHEAMLNGAAGGGLALSAVIFLAKKYLMAFEHVAKTLQTVQIELGKIVTRLDLREKEGEAIREMQTDIAVIKSVLHGKQNKTSPISPSKGFGG